MWPKVLPFEVNNTHLYVKVRVNQSEPLGFILDSCAGSSIINAGRARKLGLEPQGRVAVMGAGEGAPAGALVRGAALRIADLEIRFAAMAALQLTPFERHEGRVIDGVLGYELFSRFVTEIDYIAKTIRLYEPANFVYSGKGEALPFELLYDRLPMVSATIAPPGRPPVAGKFVLDTGASFALGLSKSFTDANGLLPSAAKQIPSPLGVGVGGDSNGALARASRFQLGQTGFENLVAGFSRDASGVFKIEGLAGVVGGEILRRFTVTFDYRRKYVILAPNTHFAEPFESDMSGARLAAEGADFSVIKVIQVIDGSPMAEAGVRDGDIIGEIDGRKASEFTLEEIRQLFKQEGKEYALCIKRLEEVLQFRTVIRLRRLI